MRLYLCDFNTVTVEDFPAAKDSLILDDYVQADSMSDLNRKKDFLSGRLLLRKALAHLEYNSAQKIQLNENSKPHLPAGPEFSISHSQKMTGVLLNVANRGPVGLDIQKIELDRPVDSYVARYAGPQEKQVYRSLDDSKRLDYFYESWVAREAAGKQSGLGLAKLSEALKQESLVAKYLDFYIGVNVDTTFVGGKYPIEFKVFRVSDIHLLKTDPVKLHFQKPR